MYTYQTLKDRINLQVVIILLAMMTSTVQGLLQVHPIQENNGYVKIKIRQVQIANDTDTILHMIDPIEMKQILEKLESNIEHLKFEDRQALYTEIRIIKSKLRTIQKPNRQRRGLINVVGSAQKWLFGTMDDTDRQEILAHLQITDENNHNIIKNFNKQIKINDHYNKTLSDLKILIENDRTKILQSINSTNQNVQELNYKILFLDQETKLRYFENKVNQILDNIMATKNNIIHPSMLTLEELDFYNIDFYKLKLLKAGVMEYKDQFLVFAIKIPKSYITTELQMIKAMPNSQMLEINESEELIVEIKGKQYEYKEEALLKDLKISKNCIFQEKCILTYNNVTSIESIDDETILLKNMYNEPLWQNCDKRLINLTGNYLINFNNCTLGIKEKKFYNKKITIYDRYYYPSKTIQIATVKSINFDEIILENINNLNELKELKYHKNVMYGTNISILIVFLISLLIVISFLCWKKKKEKIRIVNNVKPETSDSKRGGVTYISPQHPKHLEDLPETYKIQSKQKPLAW